MSQLKENTYFAGRYKLVSKLGSGGFSVVWLAQDTMAGDAEVAIKIYAPDKGLDKDGIDNFRKEYAITLNLNHSSLLSTKHFDVSDGSPYLIMQYMQNGSALKLVENIDEKRLGKFIYAVASGLEYLHSYDPAIVHQDIKPDNVLISGKGDFLLTDFGISTRVRRTLTKSVGNVGYSGTIAYVPPERYMRNPRPQPVGDIFAFGIMLFELMTGYLPWNEQGGLGFIGSQMIPPIDADGFSDAVKDLTIACISFKPEDRPRASEIMLYAQQFVQNGYWDSKMKPESVKTVEESSKEEAKERTAEALRQEVLETEKKKVQEEKNRLIKEEDKRTAVEKEKTILAKKEEDRKAQEINKQKELTEQKFNDIITDANEKFKDGNYKAARDLFNSSLKINENKYSKDQINKCNQYIEEAKTTKRKEEEEKYIANLLMNANNAFDNGKYKDARKSYQLLIKKDKDHQDSQSRLKEIAAVIGQKKVESRRKFVKVLIPVVVLIAISAVVFWYFTQPIFPKADFKVNIQSITEGETVKFTSTSLNAKEYSWRFAGGEPSSSKTKIQEVMYTEPGVYGIELIVKNTDGEDTKYSKALITVNEKKIVPVIPLPTANFQANKTSLVTGKTIKFTNTSKNADRVEWTFENGSPATSVDNNPKVKYSRAGTFKVSMVAYNKTGKKTRSKDNYITVAKDIKKPIAKFETDTTVIYVGGEISFRDLSSFADSQEWVFIGGLPEISNETNPVVVYFEKGNYPVSLSVKNRKGKDNITKESFVIVIDDPEVIKTENYKQLVGIADDLYGRSQLKDALQKYNEANALVPDRSYVNKQIMEIENVLSNNQNYSGLIIEANKLFENESFHSAIIKYESALRVKPTEDYPQNMVNRINKILLPSNIAFNVKVSDKTRTKQILISNTGYTCLIRVAVSEVYKDNKIKLNISTTWKDKKGKVTNEVDEKIVILKNRVSISSSKVKIENFENTNYLAFTNMTNLKLITDKSFTGGSINVSIDFRMQLEISPNGIPVTVKYSNKNPSGDYKIELEMEKYYKSKY